MLTPMKAVYRYSFQAGHIKSTSLATGLYAKTTYALPFHRSFGSFFKRNTEEDSRRKKKGFMFAAKETLLEGFMKVSDFNTAMNSDFVRQVQSYEENAENYFLQGNYLKALASYKIARNLLREHCEEDDQGLAYYTGKIGDVYYEVKEWDHAINSYKEALKILKDTARDKDEEKGRCLFRLGMCYFKENNYAEAITSMKQTRNFYLKNSKSETRDNVIASCGHILAECYISLGHYEKALKHTEKALDILSKTNKRTDIVVTQNFLNYGLALAYADKDFNKALQYMREHHNAQVNRNGEESFSVGMSYLRIGEVYSLQGRFPKALNNFEKALSILEAKVGSNDRRTGMCHKAIGQAYGMQEDYEACIEHTKKALTCFERRDPELSECYKNIAFAYSAMMDHDIALRNLKFSVESREKVLEGLEEEDLQFMVLNGFLADACYKRKDYNEAAAHNEALLKELCRFIANECK